MTVEPIALTKAITESKTTHKLRVRLVRFRVELMNNDGTVNREIAASLEDDQIPDDLLDAAQKAVKVDFEAKLAAAKATTTT